MKLALEELLDGPCYHMSEINWPDKIRERRFHAEFWNKAMDGDKTGAEMAKFLLENGYR